jgi:1-acyl-sn-glycerol-3-phosphate acyltransferase
MTRWCLSPNLVAMDLKTRLLGGGDEAIARARRPESLAASMAEPPREGIDWLGRVPDGRAPRLYRWLVRAGSVFLLRTCRLDVTVEGRERLPSEGFIAVCALHRSWIDPLLVVHALPLEPRVWFMGSGPTAFDRRWKERLLRCTGGLLPVWRGGTDVSVHVRSARSVVRSGAVLALFAEGRIGGPVDAPARMRTGSALLCLRTGAPIVPIAVAGAEELYRGKRLAVRILEPIDAATLLGEKWNGTPAEGSRDEMRTARELTEAIAKQLAPAISELHRATTDRAVHPRRWRWLTRLMR